MKANNSTYNSCQEKRPIEWSSGVYCQEPQSAGIARPTLGRGRVSRRAGCARRLWPLAKVASEIEGF